MKCEEFTSMLDAYIDGELSADEVNAIREHADHCTACKAEMLRAEYLREALGNLDDHITVPLEAQAAWRSAIKRECAQKKKKTWIRSFAAVAAAAVVMVGSVAMLTGESKVDPMADVRMSEAEIVSAASEDISAVVPMIASDGESADAASCENEETDYACRKKIRVADMDAACAALEQLIDEYEGGAACERGSDGGFIYRVELPGENLDDFTATVGTIGEVCDSENRDGEFDTAIVYIYLFE